MVVGDIMIPDRHENHEVVWASLAGAKMMMLKKVEVQPAGLIPTNTDIFSAIEKTERKSVIWRI